MHRSLLQVGLAVHGSGFLKLRARGSKFRIGRIFSGVERGLRNTLALISNAHPAVLTFPALQILHLQVVLRIGLYTSLVTGT